MFYNSLKTVFVFHRNYRFWAKWGWKMVVIFYDHIFIIKIYSKHSSVIIMIMQFISTSFLWLDNFLLCLVSILLQECQKSDQGWMISFTKLSKKVSVLGGSSETFWLWDTDTTHTNVCNNFQCFLLVGTWKMQLDEWRQNNSYSKHSVCL